MLFTWTVDELRETRLSVIDSINASHYHPRPQRAVFPRAGRPCQPGRVMEGTARDYGVASHNGLRAGESCPGAPVAVWVGSQPSPFSSAALLTG